MDARVRRYGLQTSPERTKVWTEPPPKHQPQKQQRQQKEQQQGRRVPVVYYLSKSRQLEHPHFIEVHVSSPEGLYLKDVINRLNGLRGKKMAAMYSWSCKRSYKNGFVWHDLSEDDLILPAQGNEYVLKGSELLDKSPAERSHHGPNNAKVQNASSLLQESHDSYRAEEAGSRSVAAVANREAKLSYPPLAAAAAAVAATTEDELSPTTLSSISSGDSSPSSAGAALSSRKGSRSPVEARTCTSSADQDASAQTESVRSRRMRAPDTRVVGVSTDDQDTIHALEVAVKEKRSSPPTASTSAAGAALSSPKGSRSPLEARACTSSLAQDASTQTESIGSRRTRVPDTRVVGVSTDDHDAKHAFEIAVKEKRSPPPTASTSASPSCGKTITLESLIRDEINSRNSFRIVEEEQLVFPTRTKLKTSSTLMQLLTCGSISVKDRYGFTLPPAYRPMFPSTTVSSPATFSSTVTSGEMGGFSESQRSMGSRSPKTEHCSRSTAEVKSQKERAADTLKRSTAFDEDRSCKTLDSKRGSGKEMETSKSNCLPRAIKIAACRHSSIHGNDTAMMSPMSDMMSYISGPTTCMPSPLNSSKVGSRRIVDSSSERGSSTRFGSFREEKEVFKIEES